MSMIIDWCLIENQITKEKNRKYIFSQSVDKPIDFFYGFSIN